MRRGGGGGAAPRGGKGCGGVGRLPPPDAEERFPHDQEPRTLRVTPAYRATRQGILPRSCGCCRRSRLEGHAHGKGALMEDTAVFQARRKASRALDWFCAAMVLAWGVSLALPGSTLTSSPAYEPFLEKASEPVWAGILIFIGSPP